MPEFFCVPSEGAITGRLEVEEIVGRNGPDGGVLDMKGMRVAGTYLTSSEGNCCQDLCVYLPLYM